MVQGHPLLFIAISGADSGFAPRSNRECGNFVCQEQWWEKFPHSQLDLGANPESAPEMAINSLPPGSHPKLLSDCHGDNITYE